jgi:hypothetical protein
MGRPRQPGGPHAEGRCVRAGSDSTAGEVKTLLPSPRASEVNPSAGLERHLPRPANGQGYGGHFHLGLLAAAIQKDARQAWHGCQATNPLGFFHSPPPLLAPAWEKEEARRHLVAPGKGGAGSRTGAGTSTPPGRRRHARDDAAPRRREEDVNQLGTRSRSRGGRPPA